MKMSFTISATSPVVWDANMQFIHGNVASSTDGDYAEQPTFTAISDDGVSSNPAHGFQITQANVDYMGKDNAITGWKVKYRVVGQSAWQTTTVTTTDNTNYNITSSVSASGTYDVKFTAITATNSENIYTIPQTVVVG